MAGNGLMNLVLRLLAVSVTLVPAVAARSQTDQAADRLGVGVVQMALASPIEENRDRILAGISEVAARGARVAVFPESALSGKGGGDRALVDDAVAAVRRAARERNVYVLFGGTS